MKNEISAGGIIITRPNKTLQVLLIRDMNGNWTFPKGVVEYGEKYEDAAKREIFEETGLKNIRIIHMLSPIHYTYQRHGTIHKTVHYFLFKWFGGEQIKLQKEEGISDFKWMTMDKAKKIIGYPKTNMILLDEIQYGTTTRAGY